ncbi:hypothetical protein BS17DRAFT_781622 [Gyrodon lividus]|nr:hypothetical protein BS17DRAFT_781622 [Gyrodon lividus]
MYIAGLNLPIPISSSQGLEALVVLTTTDYFRYVITETNSIAVRSESKGGHIRQESMPTSFLGRIISPIHGLAFLLPPAVYVGGVVLNGFRQPDWMAKFALSGNVMGLEWRNALRLVACSATLSLRRITARAFDHLGEQWHVIGRREKPRVVQTGPYALVRHPLYATVLIQEALWSIMFWSCVPLFALGITAGALAIKMPIEESLIQQDEAIREEYRAYMKKVPARVIPYIW